MPDAAALVVYATLRRQLRDIKGLTETRPGVFSLGGKVLVEFQDTPDGITAQLRSGERATRFALNTPVEQRKLVEETKRKVLRAGEE